jgi:hypothetical protein
MVMEMRQEFLSKRPFAVREESMRHSILASESHLKRLVRAAGIEPAQALRPYGFSYHFGFRRRREAFVVWTIPSPWRVSAVGAARLVSTPSPGRGLGSGLPFERFPRL